jgi:hypothetical protein
MSSNLKNVVVISDTHAGCRMGLCPPDGASLFDAEGKELESGYKPSQLQRVVWGWWEEFWNEWVPSQLDGHPFDLVLNGDCIDGHHHNSTTQISQNIDDQRQLIVKIMKPRVKLARRFFMIRGTSAHVGQSSVDEETVARELNADKHPNGRHSGHELWMKMGDHRIHFLHHIGTTSSSAHESSAVNAELAAEFVEAARWGEQPPSVIVRSHRHRSLEVRIPTVRGYATAVVTPAWQLKTPYSYKIAGARLAPPQIGGIIIKLDRHGKIYVNSFVKHLSRDEAV